MKPSEIKILTPYMVQSATDYPVYGATGLSLNPQSSQTTPYMVLWGGAITPYTVTFIYNHYLQAVQSFKQRITKS